MVLTTVLGRVCGLETYCAIQSWKQSPGSVVFSRCDCKGICGFDNRALPCTFKQYIFSVITIYGHLHNAYKCVFRSIPCYSVMVNISLLNI